MSQNIYNIITALATDQPAFAVETVKAELSARAEKAIGEFAMNYSYRAEQKVDNDGGN